MTVIPIRANESGRKRVCHMRINSGRLRATSKDRQAAVIVSQRQGNCVSCNTGKASQTGLLKGVAIRNVKSATRAGARYLRWRLTKRTRAGTAMSRVTKIMMETHQSPNWFGEGRKMKLFL